MFELDFKTNNCLEMTVTDNFDNRKYQNKSVEFSKIQKPSIVAALQDKDIKEIKCIVFNNFR